MSNEENASAPSRLVLLAADEGDDLAWGRDVLSKHGYEALLAVDGTEALRIFRQKRPSVVISEMALPGLDGEALFSAIRDVDSRAQVILMAASPSIDAATYLIQNGAFGYLAKPVSPQRLVGLVENAFLKHSLDEEEVTLDVEKLSAKLEAQFQEQLEFQKWMTRKHEDALRRHLVSLASLREEKQAIVAELEAARRENGKQVHTCEELLETMVRVTDELNETRKLLNAAETEAAALGEERTQLEGAIGKLTERLEKERSRYDRAENVCGLLETEYTRLAYRSQEMETEVNSCQERIKALEHSLKEARDQATYASKVAKELARRLRTTSQPDW